ncbi:fungal protein [Schizosaccharomyces japonicus yFS275]|uniref:Fungal protein n=1 Tax=Schizosaccharomyces japonicus (strain yFS275 / FY16936) TaxID=402676 RepID=B6K3T8_SCHJY|nr:fungal protein [Schizosaccharomyces japonicus yFS275]EEB08145.1 fungal protein [Schizosaccharomyces japonicus yFS275]
MVIVHLTEVPKELVRTVPTGSTCPDEAEILFHEDSGTLVVQPANTVFSKFTGIIIIITSKNLLLFDESFSQGWRIPYNLVTLHAKQSQPKPYIYMQLEGDSIEPLFENTNEEDEEDNVLELTLYLNNVEACYDALCTCQSMHPDSSSETEDGDDNERGNSLLDNGNWITADNFLSADEVDADEQLSKWQRTEQ